LIISNHNSFRVLFAKNASGYLSAGDNIIIIIIIIIIAGGTDLDDEDDHEAVHHGVCVVIGECRLQRSQVTTDTSAVFTCIAALVTPSAPSLTVDLCEGNKIISLKKNISSQPVGGPSKRKKIRGPGHVPMQCAHWLRRPTPILIGSTRQPTP